MRTGHRGRPTTFSGEFTTSCGIAERRLGTLTIASKMEDVTVADIAEEFGLDTRRDYYAHYHATRERALR